MSKDKVKAIELQNVDTSTIGAGTWTAFNTAGLEDACFFLRITNNSNTNISISYDGAIAHEFIPLSKSVSVNFQTNSSPANYVSKIPKGTVLYVQGTAGVGLVYLAGYYNE